MPAARAACQDAGRHRCGYDCDPNQQARQAHCKTTHVYPTSFTGSTTLEARHVERRATSNTHLLSAGSFIRMELNP
eukprot:scaffold137375_cov28-Prasinocladus_malaysianus.AAC.2